MTAIKTLFILLSMTITGSVLAAAKLPAPAPPTIFDRVATVLGERYYDRQFREERLPALIEKYRPPAAAPADLLAQRTAAEKLLAHVPASHLGLLSEESYRYFIAELSGEPRPSFGFQAVRIKDDYFTFFVLEGGPAALAGLQPWERIVSIDGTPTNRSSRLDWPQKDAHLPIDRDPPIHSILGQVDDEIALVMERVAGEQRTVKVKARPYSALEAARASARTFEVDGRLIGYGHFWVIHSTGVAEMLRELFAGKFAEGDGLILDLRGRGGNGIVVPDILQILYNWHRPIVALVDRQSRSAKDALAYEFKERRLATLVGEKTAGAVIPASFAQVGEKTMLMFPSFTLGEYTQKLELKGGVAPDVFVERAGPYSEGRDPIFERGRTELARLIASAPPRSENAGAVIASKSPARPAPKNLTAVADLIRKMSDTLGDEKAIHAHRHRTPTGT